MAVWLQVYGKKELSDTIEEKLTLCEKVFSEVDLDISFLEGEFDDNKFVYDKDLWSIKSEVNHLNILLVVCVYPLSDDNSLKVIFFDNTIVFFGPFIHFHYVSALTQSQKLVDGYKKIVGTIFKSFGISEAVYCPEGFFLNDEFDLNFFDLEEQMQKYKENQVDRLEDMKDNTFCVEKFL